MTIPKIIHQIWIQGSQNIPNKLKEYHDGCKIINNTFQHILWDEDNILKLLNDNFGKKYVDTYNSFTVFAQKADFARYAILYVNGGIYLDMDMVCRKNLEPFLNYQVFCTTDALHIFVKRYLNGIIGAVPKHPIFLYVFKNIFERLPHKNKVTYSTGTKLFYDSAMEYIKETGNNDISVIDRKYLHPCNPYDDDDCPYTCNDCYVAHTSYSSWSSNFFKHFNRYFKIKYLYIILIIIFLLVVFYACKSHRF
ncbi:glycosyl transferase [Tupanvirus deep ocean]|uniref:Glycosyl transferase n=2 Tax=Tupanvirus TaxID=2094720 RepID=A0AC62A882_9VIRU|nr:glycosyl transferase [Tupanvirus deep ocean]QKU33947.1 glycosyl transferase [Tupanvirus deep ocean]